MDRHTPQGGMQPYRNEILGMIGPLCVTAVERLREQLENGTDAAVQKAAKELLDRFGEAVMQDDEREIVVRVEGMPEVGMPEGAEE